MITFSDGREITWYLMDELPQLINVVKHEMTLGQFERGARTVPALTASYLADLGEAKGKQELFKHQSPQILRALGSGLEKSDCLDR